MSNICVDGYLDDDIREDEQWIAVQITKCTSCKGSGENSVYQGNYSFGDKPCAICEGKGYSMDLSAAIKVDVEVKMSVTPT